MEAWKLPQDRYVDAVRWLPSVTPSLSPFLALGLWDSDQRKTVIEVCSLDQQSPDEFPSQVLHQSFQIPARITALRTALLPSNHSILVASSRAGDISVILVTDSAIATSSLAPVVCPSLHKGAVSGLDLEASTQDCVTVGEDGKINLLKVGLSQLQPKCLYDNGGLMSFSAVCWASSVEFVTGSLGSTLQWWDHRRPGGPVSQSPAKCKALSGSMSRPHVRIREGSIGNVLIDDDQRGLRSSLGLVEREASIVSMSTRQGNIYVWRLRGTVHAWDLRWQQEPIALAGPATSQGRHPRGGLIIESEVWEAKYDPLIQSGGLSIDSGKPPLVMICSEDGVLALLDGGDTIELAVQTTAINTFDIDPANFNNIICGLENESIMYLRRPS